LVKAELAAAGSVKGRQNAGRGVLDGSADRNSAVDAGELGNAPSNDACAVCLN
jgi:hypothetical protein